MNYYCFTMRKCCAAKTVKQVKRCIDDYEHYLKKLKSNDEKMHIEYHYEMVISANGRYNVHIHAMIKTPEDHVPVYQKKGYSIRLELCRSKMAWQSYITKGQMTKHDILTHIHDLENNNPPQSDSPDEFIEDAPNYSELYKKKLFS